MAGGELPIALMQEREQLKVGPSTICICHGQSLLNSGIMPYLEDLLEIKITQVLRGTNF